MDDAFAGRRGDVLWVRLPSYDRFARGGVLAVAVAPALVLATWIGAAIVGLPSAWSVAAASALAAAVAIPPAVIGFARMLGAERRAAREEVRVDLGERLLHRPGRTPEVLRSPSAVRVRRARWGWRLELVGGEGRATPLLPWAPRASGRRLARAAELLANALGAEAEVPAAARRARGFVPASARTFAALCVAPLDGVLVAYALFALATSRDELVRFHAKQSLALLAIEAALFAGVVGCLGAPLFLLVDAAGLRAVGLACPLSMLALARVIVRVVAAIRAHRGEVWVMPWLAPVARRWAARVAERGPRHDAARR